MSRDIPACSGSRRSGARNSSNHEDYYGEPSKAVERNLLAALIERSFLDLLLHDHINRKKAYRWFTSQNHLRIFSFLWCMEILDLEAGIPILVPRTVKAYLEYPNYKPPIPIDENDEETQKMLERKPGTILYLLCAA